jgi:hypothetical protein
MLEDCQENSEIDVNRLSGVIYSIITKCSRIHNVMPNNNSNNYGLPITTPSLSRLIPSTFHS